MRSARSGGSAAARSAPGGAAPATTSASRPPEARRRPSSAPFMARVPTTPCSRSAAPQAQPHAGGQRAIVPGRRPGHLSGQRAGAAAAQRLDQQPGLDADRAGRRAQAAGGAGVDALVVVVLLQLARDARAFARRVEPRDLAPADDALARRQRQTARRALRLAEAALDALVHQRVGGGQRLQVLQVRFRVVVEDHAGVQQPVRIEQRLDATHRRASPAAPHSISTNGAMLRPGAVLGLQRAVVGVDDHRAHRVHEAAVALDLGGAAEVLREDEVQVAFERVAEDDGFGIAMLLQQASQVERGFGQPLDRERHVLDDHRGAGRAHRTDGREHALAHVPQRRATPPRRVVKRSGAPADAVRAAVAIASILTRQRGRVAARVSTSSAAPSARQRAQRGRHARLVLHRAQRRAVEQLDRGDRRLLEPRHRAAGRLDVVEQDQRARLVRRAPRP